MGQYIKKYEGDKILDLTNVGGDKVPNPMETFEYITKVKEQGGNTTNSASMERKLNEQKVVPSIQFIPSGVGTGVLNTLEEENNFTVVRGSAATYTDEDGVIKTAANDVPRVDFSDGSGIGALLTEPQSENLIKNSEQVLATDWNYGTTATYTHDVEMSPNNTLTGDLVVPFSDNVSDRVGLLSFNAQQMSLGDPMSMSVWLKAETYSRVYLGDWRAHTRVYFDLSNGTIISEEAHIISSSIVPAHNGWYLCSVTFEFQNAGGSGILYGGINIREDDDGYDSFDGVGGIYVWGFQFEKSPVSTSYIPTTGSTVVRLKDVVAAGGNVNSINSSEGVLFVEAAALVEDGVYSPIELGSAALNGARIRYDSASNQVDFIVLSDIGVGYTKSFILDSATDFHKFALKYRPNDFSAWVDGVKVDEQFSGDTFTAGYLTHVDFGRGGGQLDHVYPFQGRTRQVKVFKTVLSDEELAYLTSPNQQPILKAIDGTQLKPASFTYDYAKEGTKAENLLAVYDNTHNAFPTPGFDFTPSMYEDGKAFPQIGSKPFEVIRACAKTKVNEQGVLAPVGNNEIAIDFSDGSGIGSMTLEPQSENSVKASEPTSKEGPEDGITYESFDWGIGFSNCVKFGDNSIIRVRYSGDTSVTGDVYTLSFYVIMDDLSEPVPGASNSSSVDFSVLINSGGHTASKVERIAGTNIYRVSGYDTATATNHGNNGPIKYPTQSNKGFRATGFQVEAGDTPTSYMPTTGSTVVRLKDRVINGGTVADFNSSEGVIYMENSSPVTGSKYSGYISLSDGTETNRILVYYLASTTRALLTVAGADIVGLISPTHDTTKPNKVAFKWKADDFALWVNGIEVKVGATGISYPPNVLKKLNFGNSTGTSSLYEGDVKCFKVFNTALTDAQLKHLTSVPPIWYSGLIVDGEFSIIVSGKGTLDWGDGSTTDYDGNSTTLTHTYSSFDGIIKFYGTLTYIRNISTSNLHHDIALIPKTVNYYYGGGQTESYGNVLGLPRIMTGFIIEGSNTTTGYFSDLPPLLTYLRLYGDSDCSGAVADFPRNLTTIYIGNKAVTTGDLADTPPNVTRYYTGSKFQASYTAGHVFSSAITTLYMVPEVGLGLSSTEIDNIIIDLESSGMSSGSLQLTGSNAPRTTASDVAAASLVSQGVTVITNP